MALLDLYPQLSRDLTPDQFQLLLVLLRRLRERIEQHLRSPLNAKQSLEPFVAKFLVQSLNLASDPDCIQRCWSVIRPRFHALGEGIDLETAADDMFRRHGHEHGLGAHTFRPPIRTCIRSECPDNNRALTDPEEARCSLFTMNRGVLPAVTLSYYCRGCLTRYYPDWYVHNAQSEDSVRIYYDRSYYEKGVPEIIHVHESAFVDRSLCLFFENEMMLSQVSASNIATVYTLATAPSASAVPVKSPLKNELTYETVHDAFFLHALLRDKATYGGPALQLPHRGKQESRYQGALKARNELMLHRRQEMWDHACDDCFKCVKTADGKEVFLSAGVTDGVTVGHPCCSVLNCQIPLERGKDRFCPTHKGRSDVCAVEGCTESTTRGFVTCKNVDHRRWEASQRLPGSTSYRVLRRRHEKHTQPVPDTTSSNIQSGPSGDPVITPMVDFDPSPAEEPPDEPDPNILEMKGRTYRRWTHNEQLYVCCCGVIKARATFFGSEGVLGVIMFLKHTFPSEYPGAMPCYMFFDNNCHLLASLEKANDHYFDNVGLPVDVFHALHKHKESDDYCQRNCNPSCYPDLATANGEWIFNSSAAEQINKWFGNFQRMVREFSPERYQFFLDEAITLKNRMTVSNLQKQGKRAFKLPEEFLRAAPERVQT